MDQSLWSVVFKPSALRALSQAKPLLKAEVEFELIEKATAIIEKTIMPADEALLRECPATLRHQRRSECRCREPPYS